MDEILKDITAAMEAVTPQEEKMALRTGGLLPSPKALEDIMELVKAVIFPRYFGGAAGMAKDVANLYGLLLPQTGTAIAEAFIKKLPEIKRLLLTDIEAVAHNDPAVSSFSEVVFCYPAIQVMLHYRTAHALLELGTPVIPRILTELAHSATGIDIHPAAKIGAYFGIDHGTGVVIGETCVIGDHVMLYQGVTLGARNFKYDDNGKPLQVPRHPIIEDNVTVYSNTSILGRVTIGHDSIIGGNIWLTHDVPPGTRLLQSKAVTVPEFSDGGGI